jgi:hypothetical protein
VELVVASFNFAFLLLSLLEPTQAKIKIESSMAQMLAIAALSCGIGLAGFAMAQSAEPVVYIEVTDPSGKVLQAGSGVLVSEDGYILTARHVVKDKDGNDLGAPKVSFKTKYNLITALVKFCSLTTDICILKVSQSYVDAQSVRPANLLCRKLTADETLKALGWPFGDMEMDLVSGQVTGGIDSSFNAYPTTLNTLPGMSGGPVFDSSGAVVGVIVAGITNFPTRTFINPLILARDALAHTTAPVCSEQSPVKTIRLLLPARVPQVKKKTFHVAELQVTGIEGNNVAHTNTFPVDDGFEFTDVIFQEAICNRCNTLAPPLVTAEKISFRFMLSGADGYLQGDLIATMRQKDPGESTFELTPSLSFKDGPVQRLAIPATITSGVNISSILITDANNIQIGSAQLPGSATIQGHTLQFAKEDRTIVVTKVK